MWRVEARTTVARLNAELDLGLPESDDYETIAGLLIEKFRRIPDKGEIADARAADHRDRRGDRPRDRSRADHQAQEVR